MSRSHHHKRTESERDAVDITKHRLLNEDSILGDEFDPTIQTDRRARSLSRLFVGSDLRKIDDRRQWRPKSPRIAAYKVADKRTWSPFSLTQQFRRDAYELQRKLVCQRRAIRKQVLHAFGIERVADKMKRRGSGGGKSKTWRSNIKC